MAGELNYLYGKYFLDEHCELCDITHSTVSAKPEWKEWIGALKCENYVLHTNEAKAMDIDFTQFVLPVVLLDRGNGLEELVSKNEMAECGKGVEAFGASFIKSWINSDFLVHKKPGPRARASKQVWFQSILK